MCPDASAGNAGSFSTPPPFAPRGCSYTLGLARFVTGLFRIMSMTDLANLTGLGRAACAVAVIKNLPGALLASLEKTLRGFRSAILNGRVYAISNGKHGGINNKIRAMQRMHYGLRDFEFLSLRILNLHKAKHTFCG